MVETLVLWLAFIGFLLAMFVSSHAALTAGVAARSTASWLTMGTLAIAVAIALRWLRLEQGPFISLHEILISNVFSLGLVVLLVYLRVPAVRMPLIASVPVIVLLSAWSLVTPRDHVLLPATFEHPWLWLHVLFGKVFLGFCLVASGCAAWSLRHGRRGDAIAATVDAWTWRFLAIAFVFETLMLIAGAVWARDAWGRYWAWDPLETWALITWLVLAAVMHLRAAVPRADRLALAGVLLVFVLAFLTFFGLPFISIAAHKGVM